MSAGCSCERRRQVPLPDVLPRGARQSAGCGGRDSGRQDQNHHAALRPVAGKPHRSQPGLPAAHPHHAVSRAQCSCQQAAAAGAGRPQNRPPAARLRSALVPPQRLMRQSHFLGVLLPFGAATPNGIIVFGVIPAAGAYSGRINVKGSSAGYRCVTCAISCSG